MGKRIINKIELAREMFKVLENRGAEPASEIARRTFYIQDRLANTRT